MSAANTMIHATAQPFPHQLHSLRLLGTRSGAASRRLIAAAPQRAYRPFGVSPSPGFRWLAPADCAARTRPQHGGSSGRWGDDRGRQASHQRCQRLPQTTVRSPHKRMPLTTSWEHSGSISATQRCARGGGADCYICLPHTAIPTEVPCMAGLTAGARAAVACSGSSGTASGRLAKLS